MKALMDLREILCQELEEEARKGELSAGSLDTVHKLTDTIKNIDKICMLEDGGYSGDGEWTARGNYMNDGGSYRRGSYADGGYSGNLMMAGGRYSGRRYSRADGKDMMRERINEMMQGGDVSGEDMNVLNRAMRILDQR